MLVDVNNDDTPDYDVEAADHGALTTGTFDGIDAVAVFTLQGESPGTIHGTRRRPDRQQHDAAAG